MHNMEGVPRDPTVEDCCGAHLLARLSHQKVQFLMQSLMLISSSWGQDTALTKHFVPQSVLQAMSTGAKKVRETICQLQRLQACGLTAEKDMSRYIVLLKIICKFSA